MGKRKPPASGRAWRLLRLALLWTRKRGPFKQGLFRLLHSYLRSLRTGGGASHRLRYGEREFSFDDTPAFHFKMRCSAFPRIPCITPAVGFDDDREIIFRRCREMKSLEALEDSEDGRCSDYDRLVTSDEDDGAVEEDLEEQEIDSRADRFIFEFYEQMKLQRQISYLEYDQMLHRGMSS